MENTLKNELYKKSIVYRRSDRLPFIEMMRLQGRLPDVTIEAEHVQFKAHKSLLAATTIYFKNMFTHDFKERNQEIISMKDVSATNMEAFITFAYTGMITLTEDNVQSLMKDADYLELIEIKKWCAKFLESCIVTQNVYEMYHFAKSLSSSSLKEASKIFVAQHFHDVALTDDYLAFEFEFLKDVLSSNDLQASSPVIIFEAVMRWVTNNVDRRKMYLLELLVLVRLSDLSMEFLIDYFVNYVTAAMYKHRELGVKIMNVFKIFKHECLEIEKYMFDKLWERHNLFDIFDPKSDNLKCASAKGGSKLWFNSTVHKGQLYSFGGMFNWKPNADAGIYDSQNQIWKKLSPMNFKRSFCAVAALNGFLFVCGGWVEIQISNAVERYCPERDEWKIMAPMNCCRCHSAVVSFQGYIYAIGGHDGKSTLSSVERYDPYTDQWTTLDSSMNEKRWGCKAAVLDGKLYVCGGCNEEEVSSVEVYDPETNRWKYVASMNTARCNFLIFANMGRLWAIGGFYYYINSLHNGAYFRNILTYEVYDPATDSWSSAKSTSSIKEEVRSSIYSFIKRSITYAI